MFQRIRDFIQLDTLRNRLRFWNYLLILVIIFVTIVPFSILEYQREEQNIQKQLAQSISIQKAFIEKWLDERSADVRGLANLVGTRQLNQEMIRSNLFSFQAGQREFYSLAFVNARGISVADTDGNVGIHVLDEEYFQVARTGKEFISDVTIEKVTGRPFVLFSAPVYDEEVQFQGVIVGKVNIRFIESLITHFRTGRSTETYLLNEDGYMLTESRFIKDLIDLEMVKYTTRLHYRVESPIYHRALAQDRVDISYNNYLNKEVYGSYAWVNQHHWLLVSEISKEEVFTPFNQKLMVIGVCVVLVMLIGATVIYNFVETIRESLRSLQRAAEHIEKGHYQITFNPAHFQGAPREFRQLSGAFTKMVVTIQNKINLLAQSEESYRHLVELTPEAIMVVQEGMVVLTNDKAARLLGYDHPGQVMGRNLKEVVQTASSDEHDIEFSEFLDSLLHEENIQLQLVQPLGKTIEIEGTTRKMMYRGLTARIVVFRDVTVWKEREKRLFHENQYLQHLSSVDTLMGIANRRVFDNKIHDLTKEALIQRHELSLIMLDIDCFKEFNDTYGHQSGDHCLRSVALAVEEKVIHANGIVARYGGEELAILLPEHTLDEATHLAHELRRTVESLKIPHGRSGISEYVTVSLGVASLVLTDNQSPTQLVELADKALYQAKNTGRNRIVSPLQ